jgi:hypothetical protein
MLTITIIWIVAGPLSVVFGACAAMGAMCEGPCGVGPGAIDLSAGGVTLIATAIVPADLAEKTNPPHLCVPHPPPRPSPSV